MYYCLHFGCNQFDLQQPWMMVEEAQALWIHKGGINNYFCFGTSPNQNTTLPPNIMAMDLVAFHYTLGPQVAMHY
jgi:hypothetical protein